MKMYSTNTAVTFHHALLLCPANYMYFTSLPRNVNGSPSQIAAAVGSGVGVSVGVVILVLVVVVVVIIFRKRKMCTEINVDQLF